MLDTNLFMAIFRFDVICYGGIRGAERFVFGGERRRARWWIVSEERRSNEWRWYDGLAGQRNERADVVGWRNGGDNAKNGSTSKANEKRRAEMAQKTLENCERKWVWQTECSQQIDKAIKSIDKIVCKYKAQLTPNRFRLQTLHGMGMCVCVFFFNKY